MEFSDTPYGTQIPLVFHIFLAKVRGSLPVGNNQKLILHYFGNWNVVVKSTTNDGRKYYQG